MLLDILDLDIADKKEILLREIFQNNSQLGFSENSEAMRIVKASLRFLGMPYSRTRELSVNSIDCSTLISQSYWEGAQLGIPFIAENQRVAPDGEKVQEDGLAPADILVKFPSLNHSPDKTYNHVALVLGQLNDGTTHIIESNSRDGCILSTLDEFDPKGGVRRYLKNKNLQICDAIHKEFNFLANKVSKLSRLGAKQNNDGHGSYTVHKGIDIEVNLGELIYAPFSGIVEQHVIGNEKNPYLTINGAAGMKCVLGHVKPLASHYINRGDIIGEVVPKENGGCHLHFQIEGQLKTSYILNKIKVADQNYYNGVYMAKLGLIGSPVKLNHLAIV